jgi:lauroyl/myristoyl acyltransferase
MKKNTKIGIIVLSVIFIFGFEAFQYVMKGGGRTIATEAPDFKLVAKNLELEFNTNSENATKKYLNKTIEISGKITAIEKQQLILDKSIICDFMEISTKKSEQQIKIKGRLLGYDDLLGEIKLDQCLEVK